MKFEPLILGVVGASEAAAGLAVLIYPPLGAHLLLNSEIAGAGIFMTRITGIALISLGIACWPGRGLPRLRRINPAALGMTGGGDDDSPAALGTTGGASDTNPAEPGMRAGRGDSESGSIRNYGNSVQALLAMTIYGGLVAVYFAVIGLTGGQTGILFWPAFAVHVVLTIFFGWALLRK